MRAWWVFFSRVGTHLLHVDIDVDAQVQQASRGKDVGQPGQNLSSDPPNRQVWLGVRTHHLGFALIGIR
jgi:hypothetical protein